jgi:hypothetical protein
MRQPSVVELVSETSSLSTPMSAASETRSLSRASSMRVK